jgi:ectoine hydroxylase-related dioxygenase (phytanoyl-CoA dioxygenase family)
MLSRTQIDQYNETGAIVVPDILSADEVYRLRRVTDEFVELARGVTAHNEIYDLEDSHTPDNPRVRRIKAAHQHHPEYARLVRHPKILAVLQDLWGPNIRFDTAKLNMKCAGFGAPVEWHQDWAFYPHTNDDLAAVGVMFDDMEMANGPLMIVPGSHRGPIHDHHADGIFCGAMDPTNHDVAQRSRLPARPVRSRCTTYARCTAPRRTCPTTTAACCCSSSAPPTPGRCSAFRPASKNSRN